MKNRSFSVVGIDGKGSKGKTVVFEGDLGIKNAEAIRTTVSTMKYTSDAITIHLKNVEKLDITTIQNIRALRKKLNDGGKKITIKSELPQEIERLLGNTGFDNTL